MSRPRWLRQTQRPVRSLVKIRRANFSTLPPGRPARAPDELRKRFWQPSSDERAPRYGLWLQPLRHNERYEARDVTYRYDGPNIIVSYYMVAVPDTTEAQTIVVTSTTHTTSVFDPPGITFRIVQ